MFSASIVIYNNTKEEVLRFCDKLLNYNVAFIFIIDNSLLNIFQHDIFDERISYSHHPNNLGYGGGHNIALAKASLLGFKYHLISNIDIELQDESLSILLKVCTKNPSIGIIAPKILNKDNTFQYLPRLLPSPFDLILRKLSHIFNLEVLTTKYELRGIVESNILNTPLISGCFFIYNLNVYNEVGGFDPRYFMYLEDWDLSRRVNEKYLTIFFPYATIKHHYHSGANKNFKLFKYFVTSVYYYFKKWGWFYDKKRKKQNSNLYNFKIEL
jgi:GT2 family glycosyltransferase